jgi:prophage regulatory protein
VAQREEITIIRRREVQMRTGLPSSSLYALIAKGLFPRPVPLSRRRVGWVASEVDDWLRTRIAERGAVRSAPKSHESSGRR